MITATLLWNDCGVSGKNGRLLVTMPLQLDAATLSAHEACGGMPERAPHGGALEALFNEHDGAATCGNDDTNNNSSSSRVVCSLPLERIENVELLPSGTILSIRYKGGNEGEEASLLQLQIPAPAAKSSDSGDGGSQDALSQQRGALDAMHKHIRYFLHYHAVPASQRSEWVRARALEAEIAAAEKLQLESCVELQQLRSSNDALRDDNAALNAKVIELRSRLQNLDKEDPMSSTLTAADMSAMAAAEIAEQLSSMQQQQQQQQGKELLQQEQLLQSVGATASRSSILAAAAAAKMLPTESAAEALLSLSDQLAAARERAADARRLNSELQSAISHGAQRLTLLRDRQASLEENVTTQRQHRELTSQLIEEHLRSEREKLQQQHTDALKVADEIAALEKDLADIKAQSDAEATWRAANSVEAVVAAARDELRQRHSDVMRLQRRQLKEKEDLDVEVALNVRRLHQDRVDEANAARRNQRKQASEALSRSVAQNTSSRGGGSDADSAERRIREAEERIHKLRAARTRLQTALAATEADSTCLSDESAALRTMLAPLNDECITLSDAVGLTTQHVSSIHKALAEVRREAQRAVDSRAQELDALYGEVLAHRGQELERLRVQHAQLQATMASIVKNDDELQRRRSGALPRGDVGGGPAAVNGLLFAGADPSSLAAVAAADACRRGVAAGVNSAVLLAALPPGLRKSMREDV